MHSLLLLALFMFRGVYAALDLTSSSNLAIYWGQNSYGDSSGNLAQHDLAYYCKDSNIDVIQLAFLDVVNGKGGAPEINFANSGDTCTVFAGTALLDCPTIAEDIVTCQSLGKTILLSIGGASYSEGGFTTEDAAVAGARMVWKMFGPVTTNTSVHRPFGKAVVDGFDFDFESTVTNMPSFANELRRLFTEDTSKAYYLTAAPQCVYPDAADNPMLDGTVYFDAIWVQFFNNDCGINHFETNSMTQADFNFANWNTWATTVSQNKNVKVLLGIPGGDTAASTGYEPASTIATIINYLEKEGYTSFGGLMIWDASQAYANSGFLTSIVSYLQYSSTSIQHSASIHSERTSSTVKPSTLVTEKKTTVSSPSTSMESTATLSSVIKTSMTTSTTLSSSPVKDTRTESIFATMTTTTTAASVSSICPVAGQTCPTSGTYTCNGSSFGICANGRWIVETCASGLICVQDGSLIYCDSKKNHPDTTCA